MARKFFTPFVNLYFGKQLANGSRNEIPLTFAGTFRIYPSMRILLLHHCQLQQASRAFIKNKSYVKSSRQQLVLKPLINVKRNKL